MKIKLFIIAIISLLSFGVAKAQDVQSVEGQLSAGMTVPLDKFHSGDAKVGPQIGLEVRYNLSKFDVGVGMEFTTAVYGFNHDRTQSNRSFDIYAIGDYNFNQGAKFNPYCGLGLGYSKHDSLNDDV